MKPIEELLQLKNSEFEKLSPSERKEYFENLRDYAYRVGTPRREISWSQRLIEKANPKIRKFDFDIRGIENLPQDGSIVLVNHSNSHDIINMIEVLTGLDRNSSVLITKEGLSPIVLGLFKHANSTVIDRFDKKLSTRGVYDLSSQVMHKNTAVVFGEGTWNLHPIKPMQNIRIGAAKVGAISKKPVVPTIMEYIEQLTLCEKESELYRKCIIDFGKPVTISEEDSLVEQTESLQRTMEEMRRKLWYENWIQRDSIDDINPILYINHTWLKEYDGLANGYDAETEDRVFYSKDGTPPENEYYLDEYGHFVPGTIPKKSLIKK